jgi:hypothetical protein
MAKQILEWAWVAMATGAAALIWTLAGSVVYTAFTKPVDEQPIQVKVTKKDK